MEERMFLKPLKAVLLRSDQANFANERKGEF